MAHSLHKLTAFLAGTPAPAVAAAGQPAPLPIPGPAAAAPVAAAPDASASDGDVPVVLASEAIAARDAAYNQGFAAANERMGAVLNSEGGKAHTATAVFLLANSTGDAAAINAHLATLPAASAAAPAPAAAAPAAPAAPASPAASMAQTLAGTPIVDLGAPGAAAAASASDEPADGGWDAVEARVNGAASAPAASPFGAGLVLPGATAAAAAPKGMESIAHGR